MNAWNPAIDLGFVPRYFFVKELAHRVNWSQSAFHMDNEKITQKTVLTNSFSMRGHGNKIDWRLNFEHYLYQVQGEKFSYPDCSLSIRYEVSDKVALSVVSRALMTLFEWNDYNFVNTKFDGNTLNRITTDNNLGYLLFNISLKF